MLIIYHIFSDKGIGVCGRDRVPSRRLLAASNPKQWYICGRYACIVNLPCCLVLISWDQSGLPSILAASPHAIRWCVCMFVPGWIRRQGQSNQRHRKWQEDKKMEIGKQTPADCVSSFVYIHVETRVDLGNFNYTEALEEWQWKTIKYESQFVEIDNAIKVFRCIQN